MAVMRDDIFSEKRNIHVGVCVCVCMCKYGFIYKKEGWTCV